MTTDWPGVLDPLDPDWSGGNSKDLRYGEVNEGLVFIGRAKGEELAKLVHAASEAATWGELKSRISRERYDELASFHDVPPTDSEPFDAWPIAQGDWPEWPAQQMLGWVPSSVVQLGHVDDSQLNGPFLALDPAKEQEIINAFEAEGYSCIRDDRLARLSSGDG